MSQNPKKKLILGLVMMVAFLVVLVGLFTPMFNGHNGLEYLDNLYNSISKASAYYMPQMKESNSANQGKKVEITLKMADEKQAQRTALLLKTSGGEVTVSQASVSFKGDFGKMMETCLEDADNMFHNKGENLKKAYGEEPRLMLLTWWEALKVAIKDLNRQKKFAESQFVGTVQKKAVECAYNYYGIEPLNILDKWGIVLFSLVFYVVYTVWYGYAVMYLFEGFGFQLESH